MPGSYRVRLLPEASADLRGIFDYIELDSPQSATAVARMLIDAVDSLAEFPHRYKVHRDTHQPRRVVRSMPVPPFILYYRVDDATRLVEVLTIRHGARRQPKRFK